MCRCVQELYRSFSQGLSSSLLRSAARRKKLTIIEMTDTPSFLLRTRLQLLPPPESSDIKRRFPHARQLNNARNPLQEIDARNSSQPYVPLRRSSRLGIARYQLEWLFARRIRRTSWEFFCAWKWEWSGVWAREWERCGREKESGQFTRWVCDGWNGREKITRKFFRDGFIPNGILRRYSPFFLLYDEHQFYHFSSYDRFDEFFRYFSAA